MEFREPIVDKVSLRTLRHLLLSIRTSDHIAARRRRTQEPETLKDCHLLTEEVAPLFPPER